MSHNPKSLLMKLNLRGRKSPLLHYAWDGARRIDFRIQIYNEGRAPVTPYSTQ
jgi:hypothetical protein